MELTTERRGGQRLPRRLREHETRIGDATHRLSAFPFDGNRHMLLWILEQFATDEPATVIVRGTFRAAGAATVGFLLTVLLGPRWIAWLRRRFREPLETRSPQLTRLQKAKQWTPTMGGLFIVGGLLLGSLVWADLRNPYVAVTLTTVAALGILGALDDLTKLARRGPGLSVRTKLVFQTIIALVAGLWLYQIHQATPDGLMLQLPVAGTIGDLGLWYVPLAVVFIVGFSNAVNLTDGLDGLAAGCTLLSLMTMAVVAYLGGNFIVSSHAISADAHHAGEMLVVAAAASGGVLGFLWFNCYPAHVFMGDTGSQPLGGLLAMMALCTRHELLLLVVGGVFVVEAASVVLQVGSFRLRKKRVLRCAPLHHHFQFEGWSETQIVVRFWIAAAICASMGLGSLRFSDRTTTHFEPITIHADSIPGGVPGGTVDSERRGGRSFEEFWGRQLSTDRTTPRKVHGQEMAWAGKSLNSSPEIPGPSEPDLSSGPLY